MSALVSFDTALLLIVAFGIGWGLGFAAGWYRRAKKVRS